MVSECVWTHKHVCVCSVWVWQCDCWVLAHHTLLWPKQITRKKKTHTEAPVSLTSAVPKHTTVCIHTEVACVPFCQCEQRASFRHTTPRALNMSWNGGMLKGIMQLGLTDTDWSLVCACCLKGIQRNPPPPCHTVEMCWPTSWTRKVTAHIFMLCTKIQALYLKENKDIREDKDMVCAQPQLNTVYLQYVCGIA